MAEPAAVAGRAPAWAAGLMAASGFAALGDQIVWTQQASVWLGHESAGVLAVVTAFFAGLALGALLLGERLARSADPRRGYVLCEVVIGLWSLVLVLAMAPVGRALTDLIGPEPSAAWQWGVAFAGVFVLLLPASAAMGATLPAIERAVAAGQANGRAVPALYAANTAGAVAGVLTAAFWLLPTWGLTVTAGVCAALNALCAAVAWVALKPAPHGAAATALPAPAAVGRGLPWVLGLTGLLGIGYEVLVVRVLRQVAENTVYTFAMLLAVYLVGTALGAAAYARVVARRRAGAPDADLDPLQRTLLRALALACLLGLLGLHGAEVFKAAVLAALGPGLAAALAAEAALAVLTFGLPTVLMGALFAHLATRAMGRGVPLGRALAINTLGAALAAPCFGVLLAPWLGSQGALLVVAGGYLALSLRGAVWRAPTPALAPALTLGAALAAVALWMPPLLFVTVPPGGQVVSYREGAMAAVSVVADADGVRRLRIDNRQQEGSSATLQADARQALLPMLLHPAPRDALFLGLGTGVTSTTAAQDTALRVQAVELLPEVVQAARLFDDVVPAAGARRHPDVTVADARRHVRASPRRYDLIVADNFHPARSGSAALYTVEHFQAVRERLAPGGLFCQWLPLHQMDLPTLRSIVRSFVTVYPGALAVLATNSLETPVVGLVAQADGTPFRVADWRQRLASAALPVPLADFGLVDDLALGGAFIAGPAALRAWSAGAPPNTDDHPVVAWLAPRITYAPDSLPRNRLLALLQTLQVTPAEVLGPAAEPAESARLAAYWAARDAFLTSGRNVRPAADVRGMLAQVREPLLQVLATSPDFRPAYEPLLRMAAALAATDPAAARELLTELARRAPRWPEAVQMLSQLDSPGVPPKP